MEKGYRVVIVSGSYNHLFEEFPKTKGKYTLEEIDGIVFCWVKVPKYRAKSGMRFWSMIRFALNCLHLPVKKLNKPDVILVSSMPIFPVFSAWWKRDFWGASKLIFEIRDLWPKSLIQLGGYSPFHPAVWFIGWFEKLAYRKADFIVSVLPRAKPHVEEVAGKKVDFACIPNGISPHFQIKEQIEAEVGKLIPKDKFIVGYTGTLGLANAMEYFIKAARILESKTEIHFLIVGDGYHKGDLEQLASGLSNVTFVPKIPKNQVQTILEKVDVCFIGWRKIPLYNFGVSANKYFDYMLAKKPILVSADFITDPVEESGCGIRVEAESPSHIAEGIIQLLEMNYSDRMEMGEKGYRYVMQNHLYAYLSKRYLEVFE